MRATMTFTRTLPALIVAGVLALASRPAFAQQEHAHEQPEPPGVKWSFSGPFGKFDRAQLQRGFKVYREVCQNCHSLTMVSFRNLAEPGGPGFGVAQVRAIAGEYKIKAGPNDQGEMFDRPGQVGDYFPAPFPNEQAARVANGGAYPPDLSVIAKARTYERGFPRFLLDLVTQYQEQGVDYLVALLKGYEQTPQGMQMAPGMMYNKYFPGHGIAMPPPLSDGQIVYDDGTAGTVDQYARDVAAFLAWAAEPHMEARKRLGFQVIVFLIVLSGLLYFTKKRVWREVQMHPEELQRKS